MSRLGWFGIVLSLIYIGSIGYLQQDKLANILGLELNSFGDFLAGWLGPLGLFWLVLGFFQQGAELRNSIKALDLQTDELKQSVDAQNKLAVATNEQLQLQQEEFALTTQELMKARQPKFIVTYLGIDDRSGAAWEIKGTGSLRHKLAFANVGGTACEVELSIGYGELRPNNDTVVVWPQFETKHRHVELYADDSHDDVIRLDVSYKDADREQFTEMFHFIRVSHGEKPEFEIQQVC